MRFLRKSYEAVAQTVALGSLIMILSGAIIRGFDFELFISMIAFWLLISAILMVDLYALSWVGLWQGLKQKQVNRALNRSLVLIMAMPWLVFLIGLAWIYIVVPQPYMGFFGFLWLLISRLVNHAFWCAWSINQLYDQFHEMAIAHTERVSA